MLNSTLTRYTEAAGSVIASASHETFLNQNQHSDTFSSFEKTGPNHRIPQNFAKDQNDKRLNALSNCEGTSARGAAVRSGDAPAKVVEIAKISSFFPESAFLRLAAMSVETQMSDRAIKVLSSIYILDKHIDTNEWTLPPQFAKLSTRFDWGMNTDEFSTKTAGFVHCQELVGGL
jgi:hypothetical protein